MLRTLAGRNAFPRASVLVLATLTFAGAGLAQPSPVPVSGEPPSVVGRIIETFGHVSHKAAAAPEWERAERNWPIVVGDAIYAASDGRAKLEIANAVVAVRPNGVVDLTALDERSASLRVNAGIASIATPGAGSSIRVLTPQGTATLGPNGLYRISAGEEGLSSEIAVCRGNAVLGGGQTRLAEGQMAVSSGDPSAPRTNIATVPPGTCETAGQGDAELPPKVSRRMTGIRDLAEHGRWAKTATGADVWFPDDIGEGWAPYRKGRWMSVAPWGWTWLDDAPWGFAPFHYGRWTEIEGRWGWLPGEHAETPVYSPAMVAFVEPPADAFTGTGPAYGWVPLGPDEIYRPAYAGGGSDYARRINMNVIGIGAASIGTLMAAPLAVAALRNRRAVTVAPVAAITGGRPIGAAALPTRAPVLASVPVKNPGQGLAPRGPGGMRLPGVPGARPALAPPQVIPPLPVRSNAPPARAVPPVEAAPRPGPASAPVATSSRPSARTGAAQAKGKPGPARPAAPRQNPAAPAASGVKSARPPEARPAGTRTAPVAAPMTAPAQRPSAQPPQSPAARPAPPAGGAGPARPAPRPAPVTRPAAPASTPAPQRQAPPQPAQQRP